MMAGGKSKSGRRARVDCVIDLETRPDRFAAVLAGRRRLTDSSPLQEIRTASAMHLRRDEAGGLQDLTIATWHGDEFREAEIIVNLIEAMCTALRSGGRIVTYNGYRHDIPLLHVRQMRWWLNSGEELRALLQRGSAHFDVMREITATLPKAPSLREACAMLGFTLTGPITTVTERKIPYEVEKCETDVVGTALLYLHIVSDRDGLTQNLSEALGVIGAALRRMAPVHPHFARFARSPMLGEGAGPWGHAEGGAVSGTR